jgi:hypothetical protein
MKKKKKTRGKKGISTSFFPIHPTPPKKEILKLKKTPYPSNYHIIKLLNFSSSL